MSCTSHTLTGVSLGGERGWGWLSVSPHLGPGADGSGVAFS